MSVATLTKKILHAALFYEIWDAMKVTFRHMFHRPITFQYPREQRTLPDTHRGALSLLRYDDGPGLHLKTPFLDEARYFDSRILTMDAEELSRLRWKEIAMIPQSAMIAGTGKMWTCQNQCAFAAAPTKP